MKKKEVSIYLAMEIDGQKTQVQFQKESLRNWLNGLKVKPSDETVELSFKLGEKNM